MSAYVETKMTKSTVSFTSTFAGVSGYPATLGAYTTSPVVELGDKMWSLRIYPGGYDEESRGHLSCFVVYESRGQSRAQFKIAVVNQKGWKNHSYESDSVKLFVNSPDYGDTVHWGDSKFISNSDIRNQSNGFCVEDKLVIKVELTVFGDIEQSVLSSHAPAVGSPSKARSLSEEMSSLLYDDGIADVTLRVGGGEGEGDITAIPAHKFILCLRSEVFRAMLTGGMAESASREICIPDFDAAVVREFLHFVYADSPSSARALETHAEGLLAIACKYQVRGLETLCENHLCASLSLSNAVHVLALADMYEAQRLKGRALQFIAHNAKAVVQSETFRDLPLGLYPEVMMAVVGAPSVGSGSGLGGGGGGGLGPIFSSPQSVGAGPASGGGGGGPGVVHSADERGSLSMEY